MKTKSSNAECSTYEIPKSDWLKGRIIQFGVVILWLLFALGQLFFSSSRGSGIATLTVGGWFIYKSLGFKQEIENRKIGLAIRVRISNEKIEAWAPYWKYISFKWNEVTHLSEFDLSAGKALLLISPNNLQNRQIAIGDYIPRFNELHSIIISRATHLASDNISQNDIQQGIINSKWNCPMCNSENIQTNSCRICGHEIPEK